MDVNKKKMDGNKEASHQRRISGMAKKAKELSILSDTETLFLSFNPNGKAELVLGPNTKFEDLVNRFVNLSPKERYESKLEGIKALKEAFKENSDHEIDVQQRMNLGGSRTSHVIEQDQQSFLNLTEEIYLKDKKFAELGNMEQLKILKAAFETCIELTEKKKMKMSRLRERANVSTSAVQHLAMNHPAPLNGNDLMNSGSNSDDLLLAAPQKDNAMT